MVMLGTPLTYIPCPEDDHDWFYDLGDPDVGVDAAWICTKCGAVDADREPPSDEP